MNSAQNKTTSPTISWATINRVLSLATPHKKKFFYGIVLGLFLAILSPVKPWLVMYTIDHYINDKLLDFIIYGCIFLFAISVLEAGLRFAFEYLASWIGQHIIKELRESVFRKILGLKVRQFDKTPLGVFTSRSIDDTERINDVFSSGLLPVIIDFASLLAILSYMFYLNVSLSLICLAPTPFLFLATWFFKQHVNKSFHRVRNAVAKLNSFVNEYLSGIGIVQTFVNEKAALNQFEKRNEEHRKQNTKAIFAYSVFFPVVEVLSAVSIGFMVWWTANTSVPPGQIISFIMCINALFRPLRFIADRFNTIQMGMHAAKRAFGVLDNTDTLENGSYIPKSPIKGKIEFNSVAFSYTKDKQVLQDISFSVRPGESVGIVGRTGSGKTSIISLINRLYEHQKGSISVDDVSVQEYDIHFLRKNIGFVSQDVFLFGGTLYENLVFATPSASRNDVYSLCKKIGLNDFVTSLPGQFDFVVTEGGSNLSAGQRQLISLARVLLYMPPIIIMDEATSSIDKRVEKLIDIAIGELLKDRTSIIIAHRQNTLSRTNRILIIEQGRIIEESSYKELIKSERHYIQPSEKNANVSRETFMGCG